MSIYFKRQSDDEAVLLYKASTYCYKKEYTLKYIIISFSLFFCFMGIFLNIWLFMSTRTMPQLLEDGITVNPEWEKIHSLFSMLTSINSLVASGYIIIQMLLNIKCNTYHREAVHIEEMYDNYVYGLKPNVYTTKTISQPMLLAYARKLKHTDTGYKTKYFPVDSNDECMVFNNQKNIIEENYEVLDYAKDKWFMLAWVSVIVLIIACGLIVNGNLLETLQIIFFPSLSAITLIVNSWNSHTNTRNVTHTALNALNQSTEYKSSTNLRNIQDAIFNFRMRSFMVPNFIVKKYRKFNAKRTKKMDKLHFKDTYKSAYDQISKTDYSTVTTAKPVQRKKTTTKKSTTTTTAAKKKTTTKSAD